MASKKNCTGIFCLATKGAARLAGMAVRSFTIPMKCVDYERAKNEYDAAMKGVFVVNHFALLGGSIHHSQIRKPFSMDSVEGQRTIEIKRRAMAFAAADLVHEYALNGKVFDIEKMEVIDTFVQDTPKGQQIITAAKASLETTRFDKEHPQFTSDQNTDTPDNTLQ